jgi:hypothetical protein
MQSLLEDAARFVPELAPLVERAIGYTPMPDPSTGPIFKWDQPSPTEWRLVEAIARLRPSWRAAAANAEKEAGPEVIGFGEPDEP